MTNNLAVKQQSTDDLISIVLSDDWSVSIHLTPLPVVFLVLLLVLVLMTLRFWAARSLSDFEIDSAEFGLGDQKVSFKPNDIDRQIAYSIWVELSTRKIGLPIDVENDVIAEVYESWYAFFGVTRDLIKDIPVSKVRNDSTGKIISLSIEVLNEGLRPHLTKWQARFRHWYGRQIETKDDISPQDLQKKFPKYDELSGEMLLVNKKLISYRKKMEELVKQRK